MSAWRFLSGYTAHTRAELKAVHRACRSIAATVEGFAHSRATRKIHHGSLEAHTLELSTVERGKMDVLVAVQERRR